MDMRKKFVYNRNMKITIDIDTTLDESEIHIRCPEVTEDIASIQRMVSRLDARTRQMIFYIDDTEYYFPVKKILFFETVEKGIAAHTEDQEFIVKYKLYELEELLPEYFVRVSKSTILNTRKVYSITRSITSSSKVEFQHTHKVVYVSRNYYKPLKCILDNRYTER